MAEVKVGDIAEAYNPEFTLSITIGEDSEQKLATGKLKLPFVDGQLTGLNEAITEVLENTVEFLKKEAQK